MLTDNIKSEIKKVIVGKDEIIEKVLTAILAQGHILLEDVPGVGKTSLALAFSKALGLDCKRIWNVSGMFSCSVALPVCVIQMFAT